MDVLEYFFSWAVRCKAYLQVFLRDPFGNPKSQEIWTANGIKTDLLTSKQVESSSLWIKNILESAPHDITWHSASLNIMQIWALQVLLKVHKDNWVIFMENPPKRLDYLYGNPQSQISFKDNPQKQLYELCWSPQSESNVLYGQSTK